MKPTQGLFALSSVYLCIWLALAHATDVCPPSFDPPKGASTVPQFIVLGFDDNNLADGMEWFLNLSRDLHNPGDGNRATFDRAPVKATFFFKGWVEDEAQVEAVHKTWKMAYDQGHEIANHTFTHEVVNAGDSKSWLSEITKCDSVLEMLGIPKSTVVGFRIPKLAGSEATFEALKQRGIQYDCSVEHFADITSGKYIWPYTLENGRDPKTSYNMPPNGKYPGMWEFPVHQFSNGSTGFDYNVWSSGTSGSGFCDLMKSTLKAHSSNKAPLLIGVHSDYYSLKNKDADGAFAAKGEERRKGLADFIHYALTQSDVRFVTFKALLAWMRNPNNPTGIDDVLPVTPSKGFRISMREKTIGIHLPTPGRFICRLFSAKGTLLYQTSIDAVSTTASLIVPQSLLRSGIYMLQIDNGTNHRTQQLTIVSGSR
ncbi:MAG: polysaccharide deacetylase family protein [Chitinivibrionales bacterium]|nr:polysaccharide deacetylase family protein [Chitinivibrionales bacterium]